jgi:hypothetical protein
MAAGAESNQLALVTRNPHDFIGSDELVTVIAI